MEKDCKWYFGSEGGIDIGPNDPIHQTFKGSPYYSIVREAIQNSLDAVNDNSLPVKVRFEYFELDRNNYPEFFQLEDHIKQSLAFFPNNLDAKRLFSDMLSYLNGNEASKKKSKISCLRISDSNTKGMQYVEDDTQSSFYAFLRAAGVSFKMLGGSGGSFGFGKGAYFALSPIKTLIVSSKDLQGNVLFEGATRLTTHKNASGQKLTAYGFYDSNNGKPIINEDDIPEIFKRKEVGTDINVIGLWDETDRNRLMIKSVLNNFWLAIHEHKLEVAVNETIISKENLEQIIDEYFHNEYESGNTKEIESWNPKAYFKAVKYANANEQFKVYRDNLGTLGNVTLYFYLEKGLPNRIAFFRSPKMVVYKTTNRKVNGYAAVFVCDNKEGNDILRLMENPEHNEWRKENHPKDEGKVHKIARKAESELSDYINRKLDSLAKINTSKKVAFMGLEDYLSIPEDLLEKDEDNDLSGENSNTNAGKLTTELSLYETGMQTTNNDSLNIKPSIKSKSEIKEDDSVIPDEKGELDITTGGGTIDTPPEPPPHIHSGDAELNKGSITDDKLENKVLRQVQLRVAAQIEHGFVVHNLIINTTEAFENGEIELLVSGDNDREDGIAIIGTDSGSIHGNKLKNISLANGKNQIKIQFADNIKHSIKIKAYEIQ